MLVVPAAEPKMRSVPPPLPPSTEPKTDLGLGAPVLSAAAALADAPATEPQPGGPPKTTTLPRRRSSAPTR